MESKLIESQAFRHCKYISSILPEVGIRFMKERKLSPLEADRGEAGSRGVRGEGGNNSWISCNNILKHPILFPALHW